MKTHDFYYDLPPELIAQTPLERRDASRLLVLDRETGARTHRQFHDHLGVCLYESVVDVGTEGVEGSTAFLEHLGASHFSAVETAGYLNLDALGTCTHCSGNCHLYGTAVGDLAFDLTGDVGGNDLGVELRAFYLVDVDLYILVSDFLELFLQLVDLLAALADDEAGA